MEQAIIEAERVIGDLYEPGSGLLFVLPVSRVIGLYRPKAKDEEEIVSLPQRRVSLTKAEPIAREISIAVVDKILN